MQNPLMSYTGPLEKKNKIKIKNKKIMNIISN